RGALQFFANFSDWARRLLEAWRNFWARLFGGQGTRRPAGATAEAGGEEQRERQRPVADFVNPFGRGLADGRAPRGPGRYTFAAREAWAREHDMGRQPGETADELAARVGAEVPALEADARRLAALYARAAYGRGGLPGNTPEVVRQVWETLARVAEQPMSA